MVEPQEGGWMKRYSSERGQGLESWGWDGGKNRKNGGSGREGWCSTLSDGSDKNDELRIHSG